MILVQYIAAAGHTGERDRRGQGVAHEVPAVSGGCAGAGPGHGEGQVLLSDDRFAGQVDHEGIGATEGITAPNGKTLARGKRIGNVGHTEQAIVRVRSSVRFVVPANTWPKDAAAHGLVEAGVVASREAGGDEVVIPVVGRSAINRTGEQAPVGDTVRDATLHGDLSEEAGIVPDRPQASGGSGGQASHAHGGGAGIEFAFAQQQGPADVQRTRNLHARRGRSAHRQVPKGDRTCELEVDVAVTEQFQFAGPRHHGPEQTHLLTVCAQLASRAHVQRGAAFQDQVLGGHIDVEGHGMACLHHHVAAGAEVGRTRGPDRNGAPDGVAGRSAALAVPRARPGTDGR